jgi:hypothetical protein
MFRKSILLVALLSTGAVAGNSIDVSSGSSANSGSVSSSQSGSYSNTGAATAGNAQNISFTNPGTVNYSGSHSVRNVPDVTTIIPGMTAPCYVSAGVSGSGVGFGFGVASGIEDKDCTAREDARTLLAMGLKDEAVARLCQRDTMAKALGVKCGVPTQLPASSPQVSYNPSTRTTTVREMNGFNH